MSKVHGAIFDVDGVLVGSPHEKAWRELMESSWHDIRDRTTDVDTSALSEGRLAVRKA